HAEELRDSDRDARGPRDGPTARRRRDHRDDLRVARRRPADRAGAVEPRLPRRASGRVRGIGHVHRHQPARRSALRLAPSSHASRGRGMSARQLRRHGLGILGLVIASAVVLISVFAPWLAPHDPITSDFAAGLKPPGTPGHPFGTDQLGRDLFSRVLYGARIALFIGFCTVLLTALVGSPLGLLAGFFGGWLGTVVMRIADVQLSFPFILLALTINAIVGLGLRNIIISLSAAGWVVYARVVRADV